MKFTATVLTGALVLATFAVPGALEAQKKANVTIVNKSDWQIDHFFLSSSDEEEWGNDQLGEEVIGTDESFKLTSIPCDTYDVKLIDEEGDECVVNEVDICGGGEKWTITNKILLACQEAS